jgi:hypothetical protein
MAGSSGLRLALSQPLRPRREMKRRTTFLKTGRRTVRMSLMRALCAAPVRGYMDGRGLDGRVALLLMRWR